MRPVLDIPPVASDSDAAKSIEKLVAGVGRSFNNDGLVAVDLLGLEGAEAGDLHPVDFLIERSEWGGARVQLAVRTDASYSYRQAVRRALSRAAGICVRARIDEAATPASVAGQVRSLLQELDIGPDDVHLMLDCGRISAWTRRPDEAIAEHLIAYQELGEFCLRSMVASTVPLSREIDRREQPRRVQRREWRAWQQLDRGQIGHLHFGDYGITGPRSEVPPQGLPDPHLRYTTARALLIWRGRRSDRITDEDDGEPTSFGDLCRELVDRDDFAGADFSPGDAIIADVAARKRKNDGQASQWVEWATSHHIMHVVRALSNGI